MKISSSKIVAVVIAITAVVVGAVPFVVSCVSGSYGADDKSSTLSLLSLQITPVSVSAEIEENVSLLCAEEEEASRQAAEEESASKAAEEEVSRAAAEEEASRKAAEEESASKAAEEEASRKAAEEESARRTAEEEASRKAAEEESASRAAEDEAASKAAEEEKKSDSTLTSEAVYTFSYFMQRGEINWNGWRWTFYSETVLPGGGLNIPGRHVDEQGFICDENNRICLASHRKDLSVGTIVATPFGKEGCVYDVCGVQGTIDVYVSWG